MNVANAIATPVLNAARADAAPAVERVVPGPNGDAVDAPTEGGATGGFGELLAMRLTDVAAERTPVLADVVPDAAAGLVAAPDDRLARGPNDRADARLTERGTAARATTDGAPVIAPEPTVAVDELSPQVALIDIPNAAGNDLAAQLAMVSQWATPVRPSAPRSTDDAAATAVAAGASAPFAARVPRESTAAVPTSSPAAVSAAMLSTPSAFPASSAVPVPASSVASLATFAAASPTVSSASLVASAPPAPPVSSASPVAPAFPTSVGSPASLASLASPAVAAPAASSTPAVPAAAQATASVAPAAYPAVPRDTVLAVAARPRSAGSATLDAASMLPPPLQTIMGRSGPAVPPVSAKSSVDASDATRGVRETDRGAVTDPLFGRPLAEVHTVTDGTGASNALLQSVTSQVASVQASMTTPVTSTSTTPLRETVGTPAWTHEVAEVALRMAAGDLHSASLRLNPEHLGPLDVQVRIDAGVAHLTFAAAHADTRQALESSRVALDQLFAERGLKIGDCAIGDSSSRRGFDAPAGQADGSSRNGRPGGNGRESEAAVASPTTAVTTRLVRAPGMVDTFA